jgi:hypothetical protein
VALARRLLEVSVRLAPNPQTNQPVSFGEGAGGDTVTLSGQRMSARVQNSGSPGGSVAQVAIYGMTLSLMNQLATLGMVFQLVPRNTLTISAGDEESGLSVVFAGTIVQAYGDFNAAPEVPFHFECNSTLAESVMPASASSYTGATDVATIMSSLARQMGLGFENSGVTAQLSNPYLPGSLMTQVRECADQAGINAEVVGGALLAIWPKGGARGGQVPLIAPPPRGSMIGYPAYTQQGIVVKTLYDPRIGFGGQVQVESDLAPASGLWNVYKLDHALDTLVPRGLWQSSVFGYNPRYPQPIPGRG